jgi:HEAT repeat protein
VKKLVSYHISRLSDKNVAVRLNAVEELRKLDDPDALQPLQELFQNDADVDVRRAAQEAGRTIFMSQKAREGGGT